MIHTSQQFGEHWIDKYFTDRLHRKKATIEDSIKKADFAFANRFLDLSNEYWNKLLCQTKQNLSFWDVTCNTTFGKKKPKKTVYDIEKCHRNREAL